jgi:hypothetical protein
LVDPIHPRRVEGISALWPHAPAADRPAILARPVARQLKRIVAWTLGWTLFQWWAVIGWPEGAGSLYAGVMFAGVMAVVSGSVWRDLRAEAADRPPAKVIPLRERPSPPRPDARHAFESDAVEDLAA